MTRPLRPGFLKSLFPANAVAPGAGADKLLLEAGDFILLESGDFVLLE